MIISSLTPQKRRPNRVSVFIDGDFKFGMDIADAEQCGLAEGMEISNGRLNEIMKLVLFAKARDTALRYISYKPRTIKETVKRLKEDEYPTAVIRQVLLLMVKYNYLNDRQYAKDYIEERARAHYGLFRIKQELKFKGVRPETVERVLEYAEHDEAESIVAFVRRRRMVFNRAALYRRGFSSGSIREAYEILRNEDGFDEQG